MNKIRKTEDICKTKTRKVKFKLDSKKAVTKFSDIFKVILTQFQKNMPVLASVGIRKEVANVLFSHCESCSKVF